MKLARGHFSIIGHVGTSLREKGATRDKKSRAPSRLLVCFNQADVQFPSALLFTI